MLSTRQEAGILGGQHPRIYWPPQGSDFCLAHCERQGVRGYLRVGSWGLPVTPPSEASAGTITGHPLSYSGVSSA